MCCGVAVICFGIIALEKDAHKDDFKSGYEQGAHHTMMFYKSHNESAWPSQQWRDEHYRDDLQTCEEFIKTTMACDHGWCN